VSKATSTATAIPAPFAEHGVQHSIRSDIAACRIFPAKTAETASADSQARPPILAPVFFDCQDQLMSRLTAVCVLACLSTLAACERTAATPEPIPEAAAPSPAAESSKASMPHKSAMRPTRGQALSLCDAYMGFEKNDCIDKVKHDYDHQVVASLAHGTSHAG
jgi:hypothetical protein